MVCALYSTDLINLGRKLTLRNTQVLMKAECKLTTRMSGSCESRKKINVEKHTSPNESRMQINYSNVWIV